MTCAVIMTRNPVWLREGDTIGHAARQIVEHHYINLPVVDMRGRLIGLFGIYDLLALLVPRVAVIGNLMPNLRFISEDLGELHRKFEAVKDNPVERAVNREAPCVRPDTPLAEAIRLFCANHMTIPVAERDTNQLVGMISYWDVAALLMGGRA